MYMYYTYIEIIHTYIDLDLLVIFVPERASVHSSSMVPGAPLLLIITFQTSNRPGDPPSNMLSPEG